MWFLLILFLVVPIVVFTYVIMGGFNKNSVNKSDLLKYTNDFVEFFDKVKEDFEENIVPFREKTKIKNIGFLIGETLVLLLGIIFLANGSLWSVLCFMLSLAGLVALLKINAKFSKEYKELYKSLIIKKYIEGQKAGLNYSSTGGIEEEDYRKAEFDKKKFNRFTFDDHVTGSLKPGVYLDMSEVKTEYSKKPGSRNGRTVFWGMCGVMKSTRFNYENIFIRRDKIKLLPETTRVKIDSAEFEKYFDAYSSNRTEAKKLLGFDVINMIVKFEVESGLKFEISIKGSAIYMRFFTGPMFEVSANQKTKDKDMLWIYYMIVNFMIDFEEALYAQCNADKLNVEVNERFEEKNKEAIKNEDERYFTDIKTVSENANKENFETAFNDSEDLHLDNDELNKNLE